MMFLSPRRELESGFLPRDGQGTLRRAERGGAGRAMDFFSLVKEEYNQVFCIQDVVQYFGMGHWCV